MQKNAMSHPCHCGPRHQVWKRHEEAGADLLFIESPESVEEMRQITSSFPVLANMVDGTTKHVLDSMVTFAEFNDLIGLTKVRELEGQYLSSE